MNNNDNNKKIFCSTCGAEMLMSSRYCMKCGTLNYDHPSNESMKKYIKKSINYEQNDSFKLNKDDKLDKKGITRSENKYKWKKKILIFTVLMIMAFLVFILWPYLEQFIFFFIELLKESL